MDGDERELSRSFSLLIREQEEGVVNYGSVEDDRSSNGTYNDDLANMFQNPSMHSPKSGNVEEIEMGPVVSNDTSAHEMSYLVRRRVKSVKESSLGIEHILEDMPSRTIGRRHGARLAAGFAPVDRFGTSYRHNRLASISPDVTDSEVTELYQEMSMDDGNVDNDHLRNLPVNMTLKKKVRGKAKKKEEIEQAKSIGWYLLWKYKMGIKWRHYKDNTRKFIASARLWHDHLKKIEGKFGSGVLSYFTFLRGIFFLSLASFLLSFLFMSVPQLIDPPPKNDQCKFTGEGFLTGANCLTDSIMYQGYYTNETINKIEGTYYNMPLAYIFATFGYFLLCLIWLVRMTGILFRENYIDAKEDSSNFVSIVFCAWDFGTTSESAAQIRHKTIVTELKEVLAEQRRVEDHRTACEKFEIVLLRIVSWACYFSFVIGACAVIYYTNKLFICEIKSHTEQNPILQDLALPLIVSAINLILPYIFNWITHLEKYKYPRHRLYISVLRNFFFKMSILGIICAFWTSDSIESCSEDGNNTVTCWETNLGQEIYRLVIVDFLFSLLFSTLCVEFLRKVLSKSMSLKEPEFSIATNVMDLIYGQTLCWIGVYFSPLLAFINMVKYFILFYVKRVSVMRNCRPPTERWRASQSQTLFNMIQLVSFILSSAFLAYIIFNEVPSQTCGPFRGQTRAYDVIVAMITDLSNIPSGQWVAVVLRIVTSVWVLDAVVILIFVLIIFEKNKSHGLLTQANSLKQQIALEGKDKSMLLKSLQAATKRTDDHVFSDHSNDDDAPRPSISDEDQAGDVVRGDYDVPSPSISDKDPAGGILLTNSIFNDPSLDSIVDADEFEF